MPICSACGEEKNQEAFARRGDGYRGCCRICNNEKRLLWSKNNPEKRKASLVRYCMKKHGRFPVPIKEKKLSDEVKSERKKASSKTDYAKNRARYIERARLRAQNKKKEISAYNSEWRALNSDKKRTADKLWRERNATKLSSYHSARRDRRRKSEPAWLNAIERAQIQEMYDVAAARTMQTGVKHHVDHIHPLKGDGFNGLHVPWNLCVLTATKNLSKGTRLPACDAHLLWGT